LYFAEGEEGRSAAEALADATGADVAASEDLTGAESLGGDWVLEFISGDVGTVTINAEAYQGILAPVTLDFLTVEYIDGANGTDTDDIYGQTSDGVDDYSVGDQYLYQDVTTGVDAVITITGYSWTDNLGNDLSGGDPANLPVLDTIDVEDGATGFDTAWQPSLGVPGGGAGANQEWSVTMTIQYFIADTATSLTVDSFVTPLDIDGTGTTNQLREAVSITAPVVSVTQNNPTTLNTELTHENGQTTINLEQSDSVNIFGGISDDPDYAATFEVQGADIFTVELKTITDGAGTPQTRLSSILFDEVTFDTAQTLSVSLLDLDADDSTASDLDYANTVPYNSDDRTNGVSLVDTDISITDSNSSVTTMSDATVTITNPVVADGDELYISPADLAIISGYGITVVGNMTDTITFTTPAGTGSDPTIAEFEDALSRINFRTDPSNDFVTDNTNRTIEFTINNGLTGNPDSPIATATIDVLASPTVNPVTSDSAQPTITGTWDEASANGNTGLQVTVDGVTYVLGADPELTTDGSGNWTLNLTGSGQTLTETDGPYDVTASNRTSGGVAIDSDTTTNELAIDFTANADLYTTSINQPLTISSTASGVLQNDTDNTVITVSQVNGSGALVGNSTPTTGGGSVTLNSDGTFTYTPNTGFTGADTFTYTIADAGGDLNTVTVTINVSDEIQAINDTGTTDEDSTLTVTAVSGVLANDTDLQPPTVITNNLRINFDISNEVSADGQWENSVAGQNDELFYDNTDVTYTDVSATTSTTITHAYTLDGTGSGLFYDADSNGSDDSFGDAAAGIAENSDGTFEIWFRPSDLIGTEVLFETGGSGQDAAAIYMVDNILKFVVHDQGRDTSELTFDLSTIDTTEFVQVVGVFDENVAGSGDTAQLYVNGTLRDSSTGDDIRDWSGGNDAAIGDFTGSSIIQDIEGIGPGSVNEFNGEIASFRFYESDALSASEVQQNYDAVAGNTGTLIVTEVTDPATGGNGTLGTAFTLDSGAQVTLNADGSYEYNPNGVYDYLANGESTTDTFQYTVQEASANTATALVTITITGTDDEPTLTANVDNPTFTEDGSAVDVFDSVIIDTIEPGQTIEEIVLTVSNVTEGSDEVLNIGGESVPLVAGSTPIPGIGTAVVTVIGTDVTVTITSTGSAPAAIQILIDDITYQNNSQAPNTGGTTTATREIVIASITDSGSSAGVNDNVSTPLITSTVTVTPVNDAPIAGDFTITIPQDGSRNFLLSDFTSVFSDPDGDALDSIQITSLETDGVLTLSGVDVTVGQIITAVDIPNLLFTPDSGESGTGYATFTYRANDGTVYSGTSSTLIDQNFTSNEGSFTYSDDVFGTSSPAFADGTYNATGGLAGGGIELTVGGNNSDNSSSGAWEQTFNITEDTMVDVTISYRLIYPADFESGDTGEAVLGIDGVRYGNGADNGNGVTLTSFSDGNANDSGWVTETFQIALSAGNHTLQLGAFVSASNDAAEEIQVFFDNVSVVAADSNTVTVNVTPASTPPTLTGLDNNTWEEDTNVAAKVIDSDVTLNDVDSDDVTQITVQITGNYDSTEDVLAFAGDANFTAGVYDPVTGTLTITSIGASATIAQAEAALEAITYQNTDTDSPTENTRTLTWTVTDGINGGNVVETSDIVVTAANDAPDGTDNTVTTNEDTDHVFTAAEFGFTDPDAGDALSGVVITTLPTNGVLFNDANNDGIVDAGEEITVGDTITLADITANQLTFKPAADANGVAYDSFTFQVVDDSGAGNNTDTTPNTMTIDVTPVNDGPVINNLNADLVAYGIGSGAQTIDVNTAATVTDVDSIDFDGGVLTIDTPANFPAAANEVLTILDSGTPGVGIEAGASTVSYNGTQIGTFTGGTAGAALVIILDSDADETAVSALIQNIQYENTGTTVGASTITFQLTDGDGGTSNLATVSINVTDQLIATPDTDTTDEDTPLVVAASGVLTNDALGASNTTYVLNYDAENETLNPVGNDGTFDDSVSGGSAATDITLDASVTVDAVVDPNYPGLTQALSFDGTGGGTLGTSLAGTGSVSGTAATTFDFWISLDDIADQDTIFENNDELIGIAFVTHDTVGDADTDADEISFVAFDSFQTDQSAIVTADLSAILGSGNVTGNFIHVVGTLDVTGGTDTIELFINGQSVGTDTLNWGGNWDDNFEASGLGTVNGTTAATQVIGGAAATWTNFEGDIASFRVYQSDFADSDVDQNFAAEGTLTVTGVSDGGAGSGTPTTGVGATHTLPSGATVVINADGSYTYDPNNQFEDLAVGETDTDTFDYTIVDAAGNTAFTTVTITITGANDAPVAEDDAYNVNEDGTLNGTSVLLANGGLADNDIDGDSLTVNTTPVTDVSNGTLTLNSDGTFTYIPDSDFNGVDSFVYEINDGNGGTDTATVTIIVNPVNDDFTDNNETITVNEDSGSNTGNVIDGSSVDGPLSVTTFMVAGDATVYQADGSGSGDTATISGVGTLQIQSDGSYDFTPAANYNGPVPVVTYTLTDGSGTDDTSTLTISVDAVNDPVIAVDDVMNTAQDTPVSLDVTTNDTDVDGDTLTVTEINGGAITAGGASVAVANGSVSLDADGMTLTFTPASGYVGPITFAYTVSDGTVTDTADVTGTVTNANDAPVNTVPGAQTVDEDAVLSFTGAKTISVTDVDGNLATTQLSVNNGDLTVSLAGGATISVGANGSSTLTLSGTEAQINAALATLTYQGGTDFNGSDTLTVLSIDSGGVPLSDNDTVSITVDPVNDDFTDNNETITVNEDSGSNTGNVIDGSSVDGPLSVTTFMVAGDATVYQADGSGSGDTATISGVGTLQIQSDGSYDFTPAANYNGPVPVVTYTLTDGSGTDDTSTLTISVDAVNDDFTDNNETITVNEDSGSNTGNVIDGSSVDGPLSVTTFMVAGDATVYQADGSGSGDTASISGVGTLQIQSDGSYDFTPAANYNGPVPVVTYTLTDGSGTDDTSTLTISVDAVNDAPVNTVPASVRVVENTVANMSGLSVNDVDDNLAATQLTVTNGILTVDLTGGATISVGANASGDLTLSGTQAQINAALSTLTYQGNLNFNGIDTLTTVSTDSAGVPLSDSDVTRINVTAAATISSTSTESTSNEVNPNILGDTSRTNEVGVLTSVLTGSDTLLSADGAVVDAVTGANSLNSNTELGVDGAVLDAVAGANNLGSSNTTLDADGAVLEAVENANNQRIYFADNVDNQLADGVGLWDAQGVKGFAVSFSLTETGGGEENLSSLFPLRVGGIEAEARDQLLVKSILRDRTLFLEVDYSVNSDPNLSALSIQVLQVNGNPLPEWLRVDDKGRLVSGEPPIGAENVELRIEVNLSDGTQVIRYVDVNVNSGEIASLEEVGDEIIAGASLFENQIEKEAIKFDNASKDIEKSLIN
jgi:hypothetical protein